MKPPLGAFDVEAELGHFAIVTYAIDPARLRPLVDERFELDCVTDREGRLRALVSMVPFEDQDFHFHGLPPLAFSFGQTNYRAYVIDLKTNEKAVWFFGTTLDSWSVWIPRLAWDLPWHPGRILFDCDYDEKSSRYSRYRMSTTGGWAPVELELTDSGAPPATLEGFPDLETGLFTLTHPLKGLFHRHGGVGAYSVWHERLNCTAGAVAAARIDLFDRLGLVPFADQGRPHSVLIQRRSEFAIYIPPRDYR